MGPCSRSRGQSGSRWPSPGRSLQTQSIFFEVTKRLSTQLSRTDRRATRDRCRSLREAEACGRGLAQLPYWAESVRHDRAGASMVGSGGIPVLTRLRSLEPTILEGVFRRMEFDPSCPGRSGCLPGSGDRLSVGAAENLSADRQRLEISVVSVRPPIDEGERVSPGSPEGKAFGVH